MKKGVGDSTVKGGGAKRTGRRERKKEKEEERKRKIQREDRGKGGQKKTERKADI